MKKNGGNIESVDIIIMIIAAVGAIYLIFRYFRVWDLVRNLFESNNNFSGVWSFLHGFMVVLALFFMTIIAYTTVRMFEIRKKEHEHLHHEIHEYAHKQAEKEAKLKDRALISINPKWVKVIELMQSHNESDWKLAVIEADTILEDLLVERGFVGENIGEKLKSTNREDFPLLGVAWEAHTMRNRIAHESGIELTAREAKRILALYETVFREFGFV